MQATTVSKIKLAALLLVAVVPISMATFAFRAAIESGQFVGTVNNGYMIMPPADVNALDMRDEAGVLQFRNFEERLAELQNDDDYVAEPWLMVFVTARECGEACRERVHLLRQLHATLGKNQQRVRRYYLHASPVSLSQPTREHFRENFPSMGLSFTDGEALQRRLRESDVEINLSQESYVFFVDPVGNVMMYYDDSHAIDEIKKDLDRLLKYSSLG